MIEELSSGIGEALNAVVGALLELPMFQQKTYAENLRRILEQLGEESLEKSLSDVTSNLEVLLPDYPLIGEVKTRLEGVLYTRTSSGGGVGFSVPISGISVEGKYSRSSETSKAGTLVVELSASFNQESSQISWTDFREMKVSSFLEILDSLAQTSRSEREDSEEEESVTETTTEN